MNSTTKASCLLLTFTIVVASSSLIHARDDFHDVDDDFFSSDFDEAHDAEVFDDDDDTEPDVDGTTDRLHVDERPYDIDLDGELADDKNRRGVRAERRAQGKGQPEQTLKMAPVPVRYRRPPLVDFKLEMFATALIFMYLINYMSGRTKNRRLAMTWLTTNRRALESHFTLISPTLPHGTDVGSAQSGRDSNEVVDNILPMVREADHQYMMWCSGRLCVEGMLVQLKLLKRQDAVSYLINRLKSATGSARSHTYADQVSIRVFLEPGIMDPYVLAIGKSRRLLQRLVRDWADLIHYVGERRPVPIGSQAAGASGQPFFVLSELNEVENGIIDARMLAMLNSHGSQIESIHISDQFCGRRLSEMHDNQTMAAATSEPRPVIHFVFNILPLDTDKGSEDEIDDLAVCQSMQPLITLVINTVDKVSRFRLSREAKIKSDKNRQRIAAKTWKAVHAARASERAQEEKERKRRETRERIMEIEDPDKQRRMEEKELRRERKKKAGKMKQVKIKTM